MLKWMYLLSKDGYTDGRTDPIKKDIAFIKYILTQNLISFENKTNNFIQQKSLEFSILLFLVLKQNCCKI